MLDNRLNTFLILCEELNYTKAAKRLNITQPNVSQHIRFLEEFYKISLFKYENRKLYLTDEGKKLQSLVIRLNADSNKIEYIMNNIKSKKDIMLFGATLTVGEYIMPDIIENLDLNKYNISMRVENTEALLKKLEKGIIDFAIIEGHFDKSKYDTSLFSKERFIGIGSSKYNKKYSLEDLLKERLVIREKGSGTREVFERILFDNNLSTSSFSDIIEIGNMNAIKTLVSKDIGISFLYEKASIDYIKDGKIRELNIENMNVYREFNFVMLKNNQHRDKYYEIYKLLKSIYENCQKSNII